MRMKFKNHKNNRVNDSSIPNVLAFGFIRNFLSEKEYKDLINRLSRIEGQIRGIKRMVEEDAYCPDILIQVSAANAALNSFNKVLLSNHIRTCVADDIRAGKDETINELVNTLQKLMK